MMKKIIIMVIEGNVGGGGGSDTLWKDQTLHVYRWMAVSLPERIKILVAWGYYRSIEPHYNELLLLYVCYII